MESFVQRRWSTFRQILVGVLVAFICCTIVRVYNDPPAAATPPVTRDRQHPFDPDWLVIKTLFADKCVSCHRPGTERQDLTSYEALMSAGVEDGTPAVVAGDADASYLWELVAWNAEAHANCDLPNQPEMPPEKLRWLTAGQLIALQRWINNGALQYCLPDTCNNRPLVEADFPSAKQCGGCHPKQYGEWSRSMHAYAMHSPTFEAFNLTLVERTGGTIGTFCTRCHSPIGTTLGENGSVRNVHRSRISMEGITCIVCHRRKDGRYKSNGRIRVEPGDMMDACVFGPFDDAVHVEGSHPSTQFPYLKTSQFCGECHDVTNPGGVRLEEAFSEWQNSPAAKKGITCQHCHMGPVQGKPIPDDHRPLGRAAVVPGVDPGQLPLRHLADHTFSGPDYSLLPDTEFPHKLDWMYEKDYRDTAKLTPHQQWSLDKLRRMNRKSLAIADAKRYELLGSSAKICVDHCEAACAGDVVRVRVDIQSLLAGHGLPTGFSAERQVWIAIDVRDPQGKLIFQSGDLDSNQDLRDGHSHDVLTGKLSRDKHLVNLQSKFIALTNKGTERTVTLSVNRHLVPTNVVRPAAQPAASFGRPSSFRLSKGSLPPLKRRSKSYPVRIGDCAGTYTVDVRLNFRHLPPALLDHIGTPHLKHLLEVVVMDQYQGVIYVQP